MSFPSDISIQTVFNLVGSKPKFNIQDTTPIIADGITASAYKGLLKIVNPLGITMYNNTDTNNPDFYTKSVSGITRSGTTASVTCTNHGLITGDYVVISGASQSAYNGTFKITKVNINLFTYEVSGSPATPATGTMFMTKVSQNTIQLPLQTNSNNPIEGDYTITLTTIIASGTGAGTYINTFTYNYLYKSPTVTIQQSVNIYTPTFTSIDTTEYTVNGVYPTLDRTQTIVFPVDSEIADESYITQTVVLYSPKVWNGIYMTNIVSNLSYAFSDGLIVVDKVYGTQPFVVAANSAINQISTVLNEYNAQLKQYQYTNPSKAESLYLIIDRAMQLLALYEMNIRFGNNSAANQNLADIYILLDVPQQLSGQVIPITGIVGETVMLYSQYSVIGFSVGNYVDYKDTIYRVVEKTLPNESPETNPEKYQVIGGGAPVITITTGRTLILSDSGKEIDVNASTEQTITVPNEDDVNFEIGTQILFNQQGVGQILFAAASGVTINSLGGLLYTSGQYAGAVLVKNGSNTWTLFGSLS